MNALASKPANTRGILFREQESGYLAELDAVTGGVPSTGANWYDDLKQFICYSCPPTNIIQHETVHASQ